MTSAQSEVTAAERSDAVFKTFVEAVLLLLLSAAHLIVGLKIGFLIMAVSLLVVGSLATDAYLFGSVSKGFAARRALDFKASPIALAAAILFATFPVENDSDKMVRFLLAAGIGGVVMGLLNLGNGKRAHAG
ncbi:hypothetical protein IC614_02570 [Allosphingosinicella flava]|uniref:Uncharacterized protein n=1 Tax=Allosphingosinicella flava TaxID=2771430 RepID=A0A7T2GKG3_9SPHN|nr:hypothetical protein [Sphingosinicella flava]QPQ55506.1 hypothetical protein IC614_02570 [Sphingosinicella flava]